MFPLGCPGEGRWGCIFFFLFLLLAHFVNHVFFFVVSASNNSNSNNMGSLTVDATPDYMDIQPPAEEGHLGFFSCLPDELKYDILYVLVDGAFPFGPHRAHCLTSPEELKQQAWKANFSEMSYALQSMRRHVRHLNVLATTTKQWYKLIEDQCHVLYHVLREHMALDSPSHFWNRIEPLLSVSTVAANVLSVYPEALKQWFVAAGRLCLWPQGRRTFVGFATPDLQQKAHQGRMTVEEYATALCSGTFADEVAEEKQNSHDERRRLRPDDILFRIDPSRVNFGRYLYVRHSWQVFPTLFASIEQQNQWPVPLKQGQEAHPRPLKVLPRTVETLTRLVAADAPVYPQEEAYWAIVRGRAGGLIDPKPRQQQKKTPPSAQTQTTSSASTRSSQVISISLLLLVCLPSFERRTMVTFLLLRSRTLRDIFKGAQRKVRLWKHMQDSGSMRDQKKCVPIPNAPPLLLLRSSFVAIASPCIIAVRHASANTGPSTSKIVGEKKE